MNGVGWRILRILRTPGKFVKVTADVPCGRAVYKDELNERTAGAFFKFMAFRF